MRFRLQLTSIIVHNYLARHLLFPCLIYPRLLFGSYYSKQCMHFWHGVLKHRARSWSGSLSTRDRNLHHGNNEKSQAHWYYSKHCVSIKECEKLQGCCPTEAWVGPLCPVFIRRGEGGGDSVYWKELQADQDALEMLSALRLTRLCKFYTLRYPASCNLEYIPASKVPMRLIWA